MLSKLIPNAVLLVSALAYQPVFADKALVADSSTISFVSIKKGAVGESHTFKKMAGKIADNGEFTLEIDLSSVDTKVEIRDMRMKRDLFEVEKFPKLTLTAKVETDVAEGKMKTVSTEATLDLHGIKEKIQVEVMVINVGGKLVAVSQKPVIISAATFGLEGGVKKLQELAKLPSVATAVPVSFTLVFE